MHIFANTNTRILNVEGTIIIVSALQLYASEYRVMIDGIVAGYLVESRGEFKQKEGDTIDARYLGKINEFARQQSISMR